MVCPLRWGPALTTVGSRAVCQPLGREPSATPQTKCRRVARAGLDYAFQLWQSERCSNSDSVRKGVVARTSRRVAPGLAYGELDRAHLTKHLLGLAERVGVDKVTMRGLAAEAGTSASSVYYHVSGKAEMLDLLIEAAVGSIEVPAEGDWQQRLVALYTNAWRVLVAVPGIAALLQRRPHTAAATDMDRATRKILHESGLPEEDFGAAHAVLYIHLLGSVELEHHRAKTGAVDVAGAESMFLYGLHVILTGLSRV